LKTLFTIGDASNGSDTLLVELGQDHFCYAFLDRNSKAFSKISYTALDEFEEMDKLEEIFGYLDPGNVDKIVVCSSHVQALLVPQKFFNEEVWLPELVYDQYETRHFKDRIPEWQVINVYSLPEVVYEMVNRKLPSALYFHAYTPALKINNGFTSPDQVDIHFSTQFFRVLVKKEQEVHLAQTYAYKTPLDVVYFLLKIFNEFSLDQTSAFLVISGLIDIDSAMYQELHHYFLNLHFAQPPAYSVPDNEHPAYYFNSLYNLASCVS
jgi:hypothetical protein